MTPFVRCSILLFGLVTLLLGPAGSMRAPHSTQHAKHHPAPLEYSITVDCENIKLLAVFDPQLQLWVAPDSTCGAPVPIDCDTTIFFEVISDHAP